MFTSVVGWEVVVGISLTDDSSQTQTLALGLIRAKWNCQSCALLSTNCPSRLSGPETSKVAIVELLYTYTHIFAPQSDRSAEMMNMWWALGGTAWPGLPWHAHPVGIGSTRTQEMSFGQMQTRFRLRCYSTVGAELNTQSNSPKTDQTTRTTTQTAEWTQVGNQAFILESLL